MTRQEAAARVIELLEPLPQGQALHVYKEDWHLSDQDLHGIAESLRLHGLVVSDGSTYPDGRYRGFWVWKPSQGPTASWNLATTTTWSMTAPPATGLEVADRSPQHASASGTTETKLPHQAAARVPLLKRMLEFGAVLLLQALAATLLLWMVVGFVDAKFGTAIWPKAKGWALTKVGLRAPEEVIGRQGDVVVYRLRGSDSAGDEVRLRMRITPTVAPFAIDVLSTVFRNYGDAGNLRIGPEISRNTSP